MYILISTIIYLICTIFSIFIIFIIYYLLKYSETIWSKDDSYFIKYCGFIINNKLINSINYIIKYFGLINIIMNNEANKRLIIQKNTKILPNSICFIGDSEFTTWFNLEKDITHFKYTSFNAGFGGARSIDILKHLHNLCLQWNPMCVILHIGGNDYDYNTHFNINSLIDKVLFNITLINYILKQKNIKLYILLSPSRPIYSYNKILYFNKLHNQISKLYNIIDIRHIKHTKNHYRIDNLHLNHIGHKYKSNFILQILNNIEI